MSSLDQKLIIIASKDYKTPLTSTQKQFNSLIKKIESHKNILLVWQKIIPECNAKLDNHYNTLLEKYNDYRRQLAQQFDAAYCDSYFKKTDKAKLRHIIVEITQELISIHGQDDLKELHDKYCEVSYDSMEDDDGMADEFLKSMMKNLFGDDIDTSSADSVESIIQQVKEENLARQRIAEERKAKRKKTARQIEKETQQKLEEQNISQSIREVFRKLTSALHPDREQDPDEKARKTEIMQRVNVAYAKKDLLKLLELQLETEQIDQSHINNIAEDRLRYINKILKEQLAELEMEVAQVSLPVKMRLSIPPFEALSPHQLLQEVQHCIHSLQRDIEIIEYDLLTFQDFKALKDWLKDYKLPRRSDNTSNFEDFLFGKF